MVLDVKELNEEKAKKRSIISYEAIINHFVNVNPYKNLMMHNNKSSWRTCCLLPNLTC